MGKEKTQYSWNIRLEDQQGEDGSKNQLNTMESDSPPRHFSWDILNTRNESNSFNLKLKRENSLNI